jgi:membrane-associated PAP2 superfamily phosphatase
MRWAELPGALLPAVGFALLGIAADYSGLDLWVADRFADGLKGFPLARLWWTDTLLHDGLQWGVRLVAIALVAFLVFRHRSTWFRPALYVLICLGAATGSVGLLKQTTHKDCPWSLERYGGDRPYVEFGVVPPAGDKPGHCFPGGHSSGAFAFFSLYFLAARRGSPRARRVLAGVLLTGLLFAATQWIRGAHFVSHDLWSAAISWLVAALALPILGASPPSAQHAALGQREETAGVR